MLTVKREFSLEEFEPWSGAKDTWNNIEKENKLDELGWMLEESYPNGIEERVLNDLLWFERDWIYENLDMQEYIKD